MTPSAVATIGFVVGMFVLRILGFVALTTLIRLALVALYFTVVLSWRTSRRKPLSLASDERFVLLTTLVMGIVLVSFSLLSLDPVYSAIRATISIVVLGIAYLLITKLYDQLSRPTSRALRQIRSGFLAFVIVVLAGGLFFDSFRGGGGGYRLTANVNANSIGFLAMVFIVWVHITTGIEGYWETADRTLLGLSLIVLVWSMSRGAIGAVGAFYAFLAALFVFRVVGRFGISRQSYHLLIILSIIVVVLASAIAANWSTISDRIGWFSYVSRRLDFADDTNILGRQVAWGYLFGYFSDNPIYGGVGWYNATNILSERTVSGMTSSPHSLFVRLLSEVGMVGTVVVLFLPAIAFGKSFKNALTASLKRSPHEFILQSVTSSGILALLVREVVEDSYMTDFINLNTFMMLLLIAIAMRRPPKVSGSFSR